MGESLGSLYSYIVYMVAIVCVTILILMIMDVYFFFGGLYAIQDGLKNDPGVDRGSYYASLFGLQVGEFEPCASGMASSGGGCSGVVSYDDTTGILKYNIVYNGKFLNVGPVTAEEYVAF